jgi:hypothetical protein
VWRSGVLSGRGRQWLLSAGGSRIWIANSRNDPEPADLYERFIPHSWNRSCSGDPSTRPVAEAIAAIQPADCSVPDFPALRREP